MTTDFGSAEPFVGLVKAQILGRHPDASIVDLTHDVAAFETEAAAFWIERSFRYFPPGSVHVVVVDPGVGTDRRILAVLLDGHLLLAPDNGVLGRIAAMPGALVRAFSAGHLSGLALPEPSATFHGRDLFGPLAGELAAGRIRFQALGRSCDDWVRATWDGPVVETDRILGRVIIVDRFGNCFSNIDAESLKSSEVKSVRFGVHELPLARTYGDHPAGTGIALVNAFGVLEAACVAGRADDRLALGLGAPVEVRLRGPDPGWT